MSTMKSFTHAVGGVTPALACRWRFRCVSDAVVTQLSQCASEALSERGTFNIVLAGGRTPQAIYRELSELATDWRSWFCVFRR